MFTATDLADEIAEAFAGRRTITAPSVRDPQFSLDAAYAVEAEVVRRRRAAGHQTVGLKVGYANRAAWPALGLDTVAWAHMYDDTVSEAHGGRAAVTIGHMIAPKIEPEIVVAVARPIPPGLTDAVSVLRHVAWMALGFEIIDCPFPDWKTRPADFAAAAGFHAALVVGEPTRVTAEAIPALADALAAFSATLSRNGGVVATGGGRNVLLSPALCVGELASALAARGDTTALGPGTLISSGTLTQAQPITAGDTWSIQIDGLGVSAVTLRIDA